MVPLLPGTTGCAAIQSLCFRRHRPRTGYGLILPVCHCAAKDYESTDWRQILSLYDRLVEFDDSPVVDLNRAIVVANIHGPGAGLDAIAAIQDLEKLDSYYLLYAMLGELETQLNDPLAATQ